MTEETGIVWDGASDLDSGPFLLGCLGEWWEPERMLQGDAHRNLHLLWPWAWVSPPSSPRSPLGPGRRGWTGNRMLPGVTQTLPDTPASKSSLT